MSLADLAVRPHQHEVYFYDVDGDLVDVVAGHVHAGLSAGETVVVVVTAAHREGVDAELRSRGVDPVRARASGAYRVFDAAETLSSFMVDGLPDDQRFTRVITDMLDAAARDGSSVRAFGEMVSLLWGQDNVVGALALESLWNDLAEHRQFSLLCAYPTTALGSAELTEVNQLCHQHSGVLSPSSYGVPTSRVAGDGAPRSSGVFVAVPEAVAAARLFVSETLTSWGESHLAWDGSLIVSELATNAVVHGGSAFRASVRLVADGVRIAVEDAGPGLPQHHRARQDALHGRGLAIVEQVALRWGCDRFDGGKVLWAELEAPSA